MNEAVRREMKVDAIRFGVGPWKGRYSSVWRIWASSGSDDVYLGVRALLKYLKISLHASGKFRAAFTESYSQKMVEAGKSDKIDRAFLKWDKKLVADREIMQALDIHFPLSALSLKHKPRPSGKKLILFRPVASALGDSDTVTLKILFHKLYPESGVFQRSIKSRNIIPVFWFELSTLEYVTIAFQYTKTLPLKIEKEDEKRFSIMLHDYFVKQGNKVGDVVENLTFQAFRMGMPPEIFNIGAIIVRWEAAKRFSIDIARQAS